MMSDTDLMKLADWLLERRKTTQRQLDVNDLPNRRTKILRHRIRQYNRCEQALREAAQTKELAVIGDDFARDDVKHIKAKLDAAVALLREASASDRPSGDWYDRLQEFLQ